VRRALLFAAAAGGLALAVPAQAGFGPANLDNEYEGRAERDPFTYVGLDARNGKVAKVTALLHYFCDDGEQGHARARVEGKLPVKDGGRFAGTLRATRRFTPRGGTTPGHIKYRIRGKLRQRGLASGEIDAEIRFVPPEMRGAGERVRCYSGGLDWIARRGADVEPKEPL
jgi:hypothetical protein